MFSAALSVAALLLPLSGAPQVAPDLSLMFLPSVQYGAPAELSAGLAVFIPTSDEPGRRRGGFIIEASAGHSGARLSFGRGGYLEYLGLDARAVVSRTWGSPLSASTRSTYVGGEAGLTIWYVRAALGAAHRISGSGSHRTTVTWSVGLHVPIFR